MNILTGATGMLGAHVAYHLITNNKPVRALIRSNSNIQKTAKIFSFYTSHYQQLFNQIEWVEVDFTDFEEIQKALHHGSAIYHCAAVVSFNPKDYNYIVSENVQITRMLTQAAIATGIKNFCHVSSIAALGKTTDNEPVTENSLRNPKDKYSGYSMSKYLSEMEVWRAFEEGLDGVIVNPSVILGPGDWKSGGSPSIFNHIAKGLKFYTPNVTGYVDVNDVAKIMIYLIEHNIRKKRFILNAENISFKNLTQLIATNLGVKAPPIKATRFMLKMAAFASSILSGISGKAPVVTSDLVKSAFEQTFYTSDEIKKAINYTFMPIEASAKYISDIYKKTAGNTL